MSKKVREDAINKKIEEIRKKNEEITKRFQVFFIDLNLMIPVIIIVVSNNAI